MRAGGLVLMLENALPPLEDVAAPLLPGLPLAGGYPGFPAAYSLPQTLGPVLCNAILNRQRGLRNTAANSRLHLLSCKF